MKNLLSHFVVFYLLCSVLSPAMAKETQLQWIGGGEVRELLQSEGVFSDGVEFINDNFALNRALLVQVGADDGPLYDPQADAIQIPYGFYREVNKLFEEVVPDDEEIRRQYSIDSMLHTLFHEFGHAVVDQFDIPVLGREEDAVDALASVLLIEYYDNGAEMAINAAELFALESDDRGTLQEQDFWDEHSLDEQRFYTTLCHVYGSDPESYSDMIENAGFSEERAEGCVFEYQKLVSDWDVLLEPVRR